MATDVSKMSRKELEKLKADVEKALTHLARTERKEAKMAAEKAAAKFGFTLAELSGAAAKAKSAKSASAPKFANPEDTTQTWSGRGRQPQWYKKAIEAGKTPAEMEI